ncbi:TSC22 domain family protein 2 [Genypterus blacodes]|uniref:TSC22 domain family protein 2 n=1 Tax=Genypterus blacodes TaxID=154954 RepID=UPI003F76F31F
MKMSTEESGLTQIVNMSKMPAKKKSCFQITSVTQAQVAASSITDDTESLDDPDESRTEDVSSEIFDVSRADLGVCDRSSSEETLNNVGENQEGQPAATGPVNGGVSVKSMGTGRVTPHGIGGSVAVPGSATHPLTAVNTAPTATVSTSVAHTVPASTSCNSRFRVIKLDHGTGEPFRRGRWTCTEFYDRDSEGSNSRTVDSIKHPLTLDHSMDRDSGLGATIGSVVAPNTVTAQFQESTADSVYSVAHHPYPSEPLQHGYSVASKIVNGASAFQPTGYASTGLQQPLQGQVTMQPVAPQSILPNNLNGVHQGAMQQKSPIMPPAMQAQQFPYSPHPIGLSAGQPDYRQQHFLPVQPQGSSTQSLPMASLSVGPQATQGPSPVITPVGLGAQGLGTASQGGETASAQGVLLQVGNVPAMASILPGSGLPQPLGGLGISPAPSVTNATPHSVVQNVPSTVPSTTNTPLSHTPGTGGLVQPQGAHGGVTTGLYSGFSNHTEDNRLKLFAGVKPLIAEGLNLPTPAVNSLFGITIPMDGDEDSASGASVVAIDNKIEQAMDLVKSHLMYAVREEVEVLKEQIKELYERNSVLERENAVLKSLANSDQLNQLSTQVSPAGSISPPQQQQQHLATTNTNTPLAHHEGGQSVPHQPSVTSA